MATNVESSPLRVGVIGTGGMGTRHAVNLHRFVGGASVAALYDIEAGRAAAAAAQSGGPRVATDPVELIQDADVHAVLIAAPDGRHAELTLACLRVGKPVLCEKPIATTVEDADAVVAAEVALGRRLVSIGYMRRFDPPHVGVRAAAVSGAIGLPLVFKGVHRNASVEFGITPSTVMTNSASHDLDSARWMLGEEVERVRVRGLLSRPELHPDTRDLLLIELGMTNGRLAVAEVYVNAGYGYEVQAELVCQGGTAQTMQADQVLVRGTANRGVAVASDWLDPFQEAYVAELHDWVASVRDGRLFGGASAWDGLATIYAAAACIESLASGEEVAVRLPDRPGLYAG
jgi:myo-inositol 2-dehydrogenase/D-chiro-inositol 1-dehydrogenase